MENLIYILGAINWLLSLMFVFQMGVAKGYQAAMGTIQNTIQGGLAGIEQILKRFKNAE